MEEEKDYKELPIYKRKDIIGYVKIDPEDYNVLSKYKIVETNHGYPIFIINKKTVLVHRFVMNPPQNMVVDHIYHDRRDSRKKNLRIVTHQENNTNRTISKYNTSGYTGVYKHHSGKWYARIRHKGKYIFCGHYTSPELAAQAVKNKKAELGHLEVGIIPDTKPVEHLKSIKGSSSPYQGILWDVDRQKWSLTIRYRGKQILHKRYKNLEEARQVQLDKRKELGIPCE